MLIMTLKPFTCCVCGAGMPFPSSTSLCLSLLWIWLLAALLFPTWCHGAAPSRVLQAARVQSLPMPEEPGHAAWQRAEPLIARDAVAGIDITLRALHNGTHVSIQTVFPDADQSRTHRLLVWESAQGMYLEGPEREDTFVLKWDMHASDSGLTIAESAPYVADIWYWKAHRTDHAGVADDKHHIYTSTPEKGAKRLLSKEGKVFYLLRPGDAGTAAYTTLLHPGHVGDRAARYTLVPPTGSRGDIRAKGIWQNGVWTITFLRALDTGHDDDVTLFLDGRHRFGFSRYEIAGRKPTPGTTQPLYGTGDVGEILELTFAP